MKARTSFLLLISLLPVFVGCTIEKRIYQPGWHVEWKKKLPTSSADETVSGTAGAFADPAPATFRPTEKPSTETGTGIDPSQTNTAEEEMPPIQNTFQSDEMDESLLSEKVLSVPMDDTASMQNVILKTETQIDPGERDPLTIPLWILTGVSVAMIAIMSILFMTSPPSTLLILVFLFAELPGLIAARAVLAACIRKRERGQPDKYRHSNNVVLAVFLPEIYFVFAFLLTIALAIPLLS